LRRGKLTAAAIEVEAPAPPEAMRVFGDTFCFIFGEVPFGYLWIFPKADHLSVGIGALHPRPGELQTVLRRVMSRYGVSLEGVPLHGHPIPIYSRRERLSTPRALLVGDAAGLADPVTGEGIRLAMKSGRLAATTIEAGRLEAYDGEAYRQIGRSHALGSVLAWLFYSFPGLWFSIGAANPLISQVFAEMLADRAGYIDTAVTVFGSTPLYLTLEAALGVARTVLGQERTTRLRRAASLGMTARFEAGGVSSLGTTA
jgi:flavin-dependent dehydrogenase